MTKFMLYSDPSHGWLRVKQEQALMIGLTRKDFTSYSYQGNGNRFWYHEEDLDGALFIQTWEQKIGPVEIKESYTDQMSRIRHLPRLRQPSEVAA